MSGDADIPAGTDPGLDASRAVDVRVLLRSGHTLHAQVEPSTRDALRVTIIRSAGDNPTGGHIEFGDAILDSDEIIGLVTNQSDD